jgi:hypothetical protein
MRRRALRRWSARAAWITAWLVLACAGTAAAQNAPDAGGKPYEWNYRLPFWGNKLAERGIAFPLPWGVGLNYAFIDQPVVISDLAIAVNDGEFVNLDQIVQFDHVDSLVHGINARLDVWLFPFLNVYGLANYAIKANTDVALAEPFPLNAGATQPGGGGGFGTTVAGGAFGFFGTVDLNWTRNKMQLLDEPVNTLLVTPRVGRRVFRVGKYELTAWLGAMFQRIGVETRGQIRLSEAIGEPSDEFQDKLDAWYDGLSPPAQAAVGAIVEELRDALGEDPVVRYKLDKRVARPWNMVAGAQLELSENWQLRVEVGFIKRTQVIAGLNYRFGWFPLRPTK